MVAITFSTASVRLLHFGLNFVLEPIVRKLVGSRKIQAFTIANKYVVNKIVPILLSVLLLM